jgi:hypothetical protein
MILSVSELWAAVSSVLWARLSLVFEHLALSHQVVVMRQSRRGPQFRGVDRGF